MFEFLRRKKKDPKRELLRSIGTQELPTFPSVVMACLAKLRNPDVPIREVAALVSADPGLTVRLLKMVNSTAFALKHRVRNVEQAVVLLGRSRLESVLFSVGVRESLPRPEGFDTQHFWRVSARRAATARALAGLLHPANQAESFTAALLEDMAVPMLYAKRPKAYGKILEAWTRSPSTCLAVMERQIFPWDHPEVATWMCNEWSFPEEMASAIGAHHGRTATATDVACPAAVSLVAGIRGLEADPKVVDRMVAEVHTEFGLGADQVVGAVTAGFESADELAQLLA